MTSVSKSICIFLVYLRNTPIYSVVQLPTEIFEQLLHGRFTVLLVVFHQLNELRDYICSMLVQYFVHISPFAVA